MRLACIGLESFRASRIASLQGIEKMMFFPDIEAFINLQEHEADVWDLLIWNVTASQKEPLWLQAEKLRGVQAHFSHLVFLLSDLMDPLYAILLKRMADLYGYSIAPLFLDEASFSSWVEGYLLQPESSNVFSMKNTVLNGHVITGWGTSPGVGVTTILNKAAEWCVNHSKLNIGYLDLNFRSPDINAILLKKRPVKDFLFIQSDLVSKLLKPGSLKQAMLPHPRNDRLQYLVSSSRREFSSLIETGEIVELIQIAKSCFDIVFIDVNSYPDNAATMAALKEAEEIWVVTDPRISSFQNAWQDWYDNVISWYGIDLDKLKLCINKYEGDAVAEKWISKVMGLPLWGSLPYSHSLRKASYSIQASELCESWALELNHLLCNWVESVGLADQFYGLKEKSWKNRFTNKWKEYVKL